MEGEIQKERWVKGKEGITSLKAAMSAGNKITTCIFMVGTVMFELVRELSLREQTLYTTSHSIQHQHFHAHYCARRIELRVHELSFNRVVGRLSKWPTTIFFDETCP